MRPRSCSGSSSAMASGFRHHRGLTDQLESDLWIWRTECRLKNKFELCLVLIFSYLLQYIALVNS